MIIQVNGKEKPTRLRTVDPAARLHMRLQWYGIFYRPPRSSWNFDSLDVLLLLSSQLKVCTGPAGNEIAYSSGFAVDSEVSGPICPPSYPQPKIKYRFMAMLNFTGTHRTTPDL